VLNAFCWIHSTYTISSAFFKKVGVDVPFPGVDQSNKYLPEDKKFTKYYQWVGFILFIQVNYEIRLELHKYDSVTFLGGSLLVQWPSEVRYRHV
jgi:hypothetical protein